MTQLAIFSGSPDFSVAASIFYRLPIEMRESLNRSEEKCLIWTLFLGWYTASRGGRGSWYATFSEAWLGTKFGRSRWTAARALARLKEFGLIDIQRRKPKAGMVYQSNLYRLGGRLLAALGSKAAQVREKLPCSKTAPQQSQQDSIRQTTPPQTSSSATEEEKQRCPNLTDVHQTFGSLRQRIATTMGLRLGSCGDYIKPATPLK